MARSLNRVELIGNLTRDPELRYTPSGAAVCTIGIATNRSWNTEGGEKKEETEFHRIVAWNKLAEICSQFLVKGRKVYVQGRLATRNWTGQDGQPRTTVEIVIDDMILLDSGNRAQAGMQSQGSQPSVQSSSTEESVEEPVKKKSHSKDDLVQGEDQSSGLKPKSEKKVVKEESSPKQSSSDEVNPDDIPF